ncbi:MAG TPA: hypothetical protein VGR78_04595 [Verrucomicrobiae bacterium]|nr:hypothetical protein [Verrucomicrobiae bacterium]
MFEETFHSHDVGFPIVSTFQFNDVRHYGVSNANFRQRRLVEFRLPEQIFLEAFPNFPKGKFCRLYFCQDVGDIQPFGLLKSLPFRSENFFFPVLLRQESPGFCRRFKKPSDPPSIDAQVERISFLPAHCYFFNFGISQVATRCHVTSRWQVFRVCSGRFMSFHVDSGFGG